MASETLVNKAKTESASLGVMDFARAIVTPFASLKLTVCLLVLSVIVTFIATLDQTRADVFQVKMKHFENVLVEVPFQTFFVPSWSPSYQNVPGGFYIPSGVTILVLMLINLTAAHVLRFRLQAQGAKLVAGLVVAALAGLITWAVIFNGQNAEGFQASPPISWTQMWMLMQVGLLALVIGAVYGWMTLEKSRDVERLLLAIGGVVCAAGLGLTLFLGEKAFIGESAMRILWQLLQSTMAALVAFFACMLLFRRKAGIVLLHLGIAGLMFNEIYVTVTNNEQRMTIVEGQTETKAIDIRATEMAIIDVSDPEFDEFFIIPGKKLQRSFFAHLDQLDGETESSNATISSDDLPFSLACVKYFPNSDLKRISGPSSDNPATAGLGKRFEAFELPSVAGTDSDQAVDFASAYVEINDASGESLGTHLITQHFEEGMADEVIVDGKSYRIALRFETEYKPYALTLVDAQRENYIGTDTPRWYASDVVLDDFDNGVKSEQKIWMNNPLRYSDETFYQSGMNKLSDGRELSIIQIVRNKGWMIPYVCCMFTVVGLMAQFGSSLLGFLEKSREKALRQSRQPAQIPTAELVNPNAKLLTKEQLESSTFSSNAPSAGKKSWIIIGVLLVCLGYWVSKEIRKDVVSQTSDGMRLDLFGQIPITINGRVQPLDSFARNKARQLSKRELVFDANDEKQPAIKWLADTLFEAEDFDKYRVFRIEDLTVLGALKLPAAFPGSRDKFRYTLEELLDVEPELRKQIPDPGQKDSKNWTTMEKRMNAVGQNLQRLYGLKLAFGGPERPEQELLLKLQDAANVFSSPLIPLAVPTGNDETPWIAFAEYKNQAWIGELAKKYEVDTTKALASAIVQQEIIPPLRDDAIKTRVIEGFLSDPDFLKDQKDNIGESDPQVLARAMEKNWDTIPQEVKGRLEESMGPLVDAMIAQQMPRFESMMEEQLVKINGAEGKIASEDNELAEMLLKLQPAYLANDSAKFNSTIESYLAKVKSDPPKGLSSLKLSTERRYNSFAPFYFASVFYLIAALTTIFGWVGWRETWNRTAFALLIVGLLFHVVGIVDRVIISGRPPITNLYSSVLFVSAALVGFMLVVELITKLGVGNLMAGVGAFLALLWAWTMTIVDGDTFTVMVAVLDTQFWLSTHVVCISIGYAATFVAGLLGVAYLIGLLLTPAFASKDQRRLFSNVIYGTVCMGLLCSFFGTVLGGLWGDDSWGRFWGWDPKENGALMIVLWNAVVLHARWGGLVRDRGLAALAVLGNVIVLWSWKGVNAMGVGLHAYAGTEDSTVATILMIGIAHMALACVVVIPMKFWMSYASEKANSQKLQS